MNSESVDLPKHIGLESHNSDPIQYDQIEVQEESVCLCLAAMIEDSTGRAHTSRPPNIRQIIDAAASCATKGV